MLRHLNRDYGADFNVDAFEHRANYDPDAGRVVIELVSQEQQRVSNRRRNRSTSALAKRSSPSTRTSTHSRAFAAMAADAGFTVARAWTDPDDLFSVQYLTR